MINVKYQFLFDSIIIIRRIRCMIWCSKYFVRRRNLNGFDPWQRLPQINPKFKVDFSYSSTRLDSTPKHARRNLTRESDPFLDSFILSIRFNYYYSSNLVYHIIVLKILRSKKEFKWIRSLLQIDPKFKVDFSYSDSRQLRLPNLTRESDPFLLFYLFEIEAVTSLAEEEEAESCFSIPGIGEKTISCR